MFYKSRQRHVFQQLLYWVHVSSWEVCILTVARSFWVMPFSCLPSWMTLPTSRGTLSWCSSSVSRSSLAVFFVTRCCLFCPADPMWQSSGSRRCWGVIQGDRHAKTSTTTQDIKLSCFAGRTATWLRRRISEMHQTKVTLQVNCGLYQMCTKSINLHFLVVSTSSPRLWAMVIA